MSQSHPEGGNAPRRRRLWVICQDRSHDSSAPHQTAKKSERGFQNSHVVRRTYRQTQDVLAGILSARDRIIVRNRLMLVAAALVIVSAVVASVSNYLTINNTPEQAVNSYLRALERGKYFSALDRSAFNADSKVYIKSASFSDAEGRVQDYRITGYDYSGQNDVVVTVDAKINDEWKSYSLPLERTEKEGLFNDAWKLAQPAQVEQTLEAPFALDEIEVNGRAVTLGDTRNVPLSEQGASWKLVVLPGDYALDTPESSYYTIAGARQGFSIPLGASEVPSLSLNLQPSARMWTETDQAIEDVITKCTGATSLEPSDCPASAKYTEIGISLAGRLAVPKAQDLPKSSDKKSESADSDGNAPDQQVRVTDISWKLVNRPALVLEESENSPTRWVASEYRPAVFELTYKVDGEAQRETIEMMVEAAVESTGRSATIDVALSPVEKAAQRQ